jgi:hypothetical protein
MLGELKNTKKKTLFLLISKEKSPKSKIGYKNKKMIFLNIKFPKLFLKNNLFYKKINWKDLFS